MFRAVCTVRDKVRNSISSFKNKFITFSQVYVCLCVYLCGEVPMGSRGGVSLEL